MKPFLHWNGNRYSIARAIAAQFPVRCRTYYEPLLGGGSVFLNTHQKYDRIVLGDINRWLIDVYRALRDDLGRVISILESLAPCPSVYSRIRQIHPDKIPLSYRAAHLIYLNRLAFGHIFRVNKDGYFNVPFGEETWPTFDRDDLREVSERLRGVEIYSQCYSDTVSSAGEGDFVYFDPPSSESRAFGHQKSNPGACYEFTEVEYRRLYATCQELHRNKVLWAVSDDNTALVRLLFSDFRLTPLSRDPSDGEIKHLLVTNYHPLDYGLIELDTSRRDQLHAVQPSCCTSCASASSGGRDSSS